VQPPLRLFGRAGELEVFRRPLTDVRGGKSAVLVVRGGAGIGKTALLRWVAAEAAGFRVVRAVGIESEMELPYAGLHQLCAPMLGLLDRLPAPQHDALRTAFGPDLITGWRLGGARLCSRVGLGAAKRLKRSAFAHEDGHARDLDLPMVEESPWGSPSWGDACQAAVRKGEQEKGSQRPRHPAVPGRADVAGG
jgi:AAA ATPase domain